MTPAPGGDDAAERSRLLVAGQSQALQLALTGAPLGDVLEMLVRTAELQANGSFFGSIMLLDGKHLRHGAAPSLPDEYNRGIDGSEIGPTAGSCGTAAYFGHAVIVTDIATDPLWVNYRELALRHGLRACWSTPFLARDGSVLGTLALYYRDTRGPNAGDREAVQVIGETAAAIVETRRKAAAVAARAQPTGRNGP